MGEKKLREYMRHQAAFAVNMTEAQIDSIVGAHKAFTEPDAPSPSAEIEVGDFVEVISGNIEIRRGHRGIVFEAGAGNHRIVFRDLRQTWINDKDLCLIAKGKPWAEERDAR
jgi:hypothetical protein